MVISKPPDTTFCTCKISGNLIHNLWTADSYTLKSVEPLFDGLITVKIVISEYLASKHTYFYHFPCINDVFFLKGGVKRGILK